MPDNVLTRYQERVQFEADSYREELLIEGVLRVGFRNDDGCVATVNFDYWEGAEFDVFRSKSGVLLVARETGALRERRAGDFFERSEVSRIGFAFDPQGEPACARVGVDTDLEHAWQDAGTTLHHQIVGSPELDSRTIGLAWAPSLSHASAGGPPWPWQVSRIAPSRPVADLADHLEAVDATTGGVLPATFGAMNVVELAPVDFRAWNGRSYQVRALDGLVDLAGKSVEIAAPLEGEKILLEPPVTAYEFETATSGLSGNVSIDAGIATIGPGGSAGLLDVSQATRVVLRVTYAEDATIRVFAPLMVDPVCERRADGEGIELECAVSELSVVGFELTPDPPEGETGTVLVDWIRAL